MEELDLKELFIMFWRKKTEIFLIIIMCACIGMIYSFVYVEPKYSAYTEVVLATSQDDDSTTISQTQTELTVNSKLVSTYSELIKSKSVIRQVIENLNMQDIEEDEIRENVSVQSVSDTEILKITVTNEDPNTAAEIANEIAKVFTNKIIEIYNISNIAIVDRAEADEIPSNINHAKDILIFAFIGAVVAAAYVLIANMLDNTVKTEEDVEKYVGLSVLAMIPDCEVENKRGGKRK